MNYVCAAWFLFTMIYTPYMLYKTDEKWISLDTTEKLLRISVLVNIVALSITCYFVYIKK